MAQFFGRQHELKRLRLLRQKRSSSLVVVTGRRRIGKSRLVQEFAKNQPFYSFSGLPPTYKTTANSQKEEFAKQMNRELGLPGLSTNDWGDLFWHLSHTLNGKQAVILLDEITWMGSKDPDFLGKLKNVWDLNLKQNPRLILIIVPVWKMVQSKYLPAITDA